MSITLPIDNSAMERSAACYWDWEESLRKEKKRLESLFAIEKEFFATRDMSWLEEFRDKREIPEVEVAEKVKKPCAIWREDDWLEEVSDNPERLAIRQRMLDEQDADARLLNPDVKIRHIKGEKDEHIYRVYEGIDQKEFRTFCNLRDAERKVEQKIEQLADNCVLSNHTTRITREKLASSQSPQSQGRL